MAVTALPPGWYNWFDESGDDPTQDPPHKYPVGLVRQDNGIVGYPCAALLLQEHRSTWSPRENRYIEQSKPFDTRVAPAEFAPDFGFEPATDTDNYLYTSYAPWSVAT